MLRHRILVMSDQQRIRCTAQAAAAGSRGLARRRDRASCGTWLSGWPALTKLGRSTQGDRHEQEPKGGAFVSAAGAAGGHRSRHRRRARRPAPAGAASARGRPDAHHRRCRRRRSRRRLVSVREADRQPGQSGLDRQRAFGRGQPADRGRRPDHVRRHQHRRRHAEAAGRQRSDPRARPEPAAQLAGQHLHRAVPRPGHARLRVHRLRGQDLRRADRAAGRFLRLPAARRPARSTPTPRCSIPGSRASSRSRTTTPPPARRPRCT